MSDDKQPGADPMAGELTTPDWKPSAGATATGEAPARVTHPSPPPFAPGSAPSPIPSTTAIPSKATSPGTRSSVPPPLPRMVSSQPPPLPRHPRSPTGATIRPPATPRATLEGQRAPHGVGSSPAGAPVTNPKDNLRRIDRLRKELRAMRAIQAKHEREILSLRTKLDLSEQRVETMNEKLRESAVDVRLARLGARLAHLESRGLGTATTSDLMAGKLAALTQRLDDMETSLSQAPPPMPAGDDLTAIKGIGPKFAKALNAAGVSTYAQIAAWTDDDLERMAKVLGTTTKRIRRSGWVQAAQALRDS